MTDEERRDVAARRDELAPVVAPWGEHERDDVLLALVEMFGAYRSMRQTEDEALALVEASARSLAPYPGWAIVKVCASIQSNGVWRDGKFDRKWPPNDPEIVEAVRKEIEHYRRVHDGAVALLTATVMKP